MPHNPQQNGATERKNRTIVSAARAMLHDQALPMHMWVEACNTIVHVQNHYLHRVLGMSTPKEAFASKKPDVNTLRFLAYLFMCM